jgi:hypothetical protein
MARLTYESAIAYQAMAMEIGERQSRETKLVSADGKFTVPTTLEMRRFDDETIQTPAGRFEACRRYEVVTNSVLNLKVAKIPVKETRQRWFSPEVNGLVKETYKKEPGKFLMWSWEGYTATSTLASFYTTEVDVNTFAPPKTASTDSDHGLNGERDKPKMNVTRIIVIVTLLAGGCIAGGIRVAKRQKQLTSRQ